MGPNAILLEGRKIYLQESVNILRVEFDSGLIYTSHVRKVAKDAAWKLSCIRRVAHLLVAQGVGTLYKSQPLAWSSCPLSYLGLLDRVQARAQRLARLKAPEAAAQIIQPLQQQRDVAGMCVMYKAHRMQLLQLAELRPNPRTRPSHSTRAAHNIDHEVTVPSRGRNITSAPSYPALVDYGTPWCARPSCTSPLPCTPSNRA
ncbi:hypothetical protein GWK47_036479 [Chionoecetes opilio]|uniref:Uncharacterized protein n=1 Tax=Chionoecetes opilio TaxID=41210 RepID=A0A8J4YT63_CHIOP|nr:hypothetical protein GWK47_036479 [Chionoecetes opilio]